MTTHPEIGIEQEYVDATAQIQRLAIDAGYRLKKGEMIAAMAVAP